MELTNSQEEYLKTIYILENSGKARVTDIAEKLSITKPSVNKAVNILKDLKLVNYEAYGNITLTEQGKNLAKEILKKQGVLKVFFSEVLGVEDKLAEQEVTAIKYAISKETIQKLDKYISKTFNLNCNHDFSSEMCKKCAKITLKNKKCKQ